MSALLPGFADPVAGAQATFRAVLTAMAHPGRIVPAGGALAPPPPLHPAAAAVLLALLDADTRLGLPPGFAVARDWLAFHTGAAFAAGPADADFALADALPDLAAFDAGSDDAPERSATVIVQVAGLGSGAAWLLDGPGLPAPGVLRVDGLPADFAARWSRNRRLYPRGVDLVLCAGAALAALPRSVTVRAG